MWESLYEYILHLCIDIFVFVQRYILHLCGSTCPPSSLYEHLCEWYENLYRYKYEYILHLCKDIYPPIPPILSMTFFKNIIWVMNIFCIYVQIYIHLSILFFLCFFFINNVNIIWVIFHIYFIKVSMNIFCIFCIYVQIYIHLSILFPGSRLSSTKPALHKWIMVMMMMMMMMVMMMKMMMVTTDLLVLFSAFFLSIYTLLVWFVWYSGPTIKFGFMLNLFDNTFLWICKQINEMLKAKDKNTGIILQFPPMRNLWKPSKKCLNLEQSVQ